MAWVRAGDIGGRGSVQRCQRPLWRCWSRTRQRDQRRTRDQVSDERERCHTTSFFFCPIIAYVHSTRGETACFLGAWMPIRALQCLARGFLVRKPGRSTPASVLQSDTYPSFEPYVARRQVSDLRREAAARAVLKPTEVSAGCQPIPSDVSLTTLMTGGLRVRVPNGKSHPIGRHGGIVLANGASASIASRIP